MFSIALYVFMIFKDDEYVSNSICSAHILAELNNMRQNNKQA